MEFQLGHSFYIGYNGDEKSCETKPMNKNPDGAYIFSTCSLYPTEQEPLSIYKYESSLVEFQYSIEYKNSFIHIKKYSNIGYLEIESEFDPFKNDEKNHIFHLKSNIKNTLSGFTDKNEKIEMWTDSNCLKMMRRIKNFRKDFEYNISDEVSGNFYPMNCAVSLRERKSSDEYDINDYSTLSENDKIITIYNERPQGVGFLKEGEIMILLQRSSKKDDQRGKHEPLYEESSAKRFYSIYHYISADLTEEPEIYNKINFSPVLIKSKNATPLDIFYKSKLNDILITNCLINIQIISEKIFYLQLFNRKDPYYVRKNNDSTCSYKFNKESLIQMKISEMSKNGIEINETIPNENNQSSIFDFFKNTNEIRRLKGQTEFYDDEFLLNFQEFKLFKIEIKSTYLNVFSFYIVFMILILYLY